MRKAILIIALLSLISMASAQKWVDAKGLAIHGYTQKSEQHPYYRFDFSKYDFSKGVVLLSEKPAGLYVAFKTNSSSVSAEWSIVPHNTRDNMSFIMQHGVDLYMKVDGEWQYVMAPRIPCDLTPSTYKRNIVENLGNEEKEFLLYLPIWCEVKSLQIGVDKGATIEGIPSPFRHKVIVYGSSITHGAAASRPGMTYPAIMSRNLGIEFVNFGFAGQCRMQPGFLECLKSCEADAFLFDAFSNPTISEIEERLENFVAEMVKAHPGKPLIFMQSAIPYEQCVDPKKQNGRKLRHETASRIMKELQKQYKDVYFLAVSNVAGKDGTIDNVHPNDLGFSRLIAAYQPKIAKILKKYNIK